MTLTKMEARWAGAAFEAIFPARAHARLSVGIADLGVGPFVRDLFAHLPARAAFALRAAVWLCALAPLFTLRRLAVLPSLDPLDRERVMRALLLSSSYPVRQLVVLLKVFGAIFFASSPRVRAALARSDGASSERLVTLRARADAGRPEEVRDDRHVA